MNYKLFFLAALALIVASCTKTDESVQTSHAASQSRVMHLTATVEEPAAATRATLEEIGTEEIKSIRFKWQVNDKINMAFVQGETKKTATATVTSVSADGRTAQFSVTVPAGITGNFTLYAYHSPSHNEYSGRLLNTDPVIALLPFSLFIRPTTLPDQVRNFSIWDKQNVTYSGGAMPAVTLSFKHFGAMMTMKVKNISSAELPTIGRFALASSNNTNWTRGESYNQPRFNMETNSYLSGTGDLGSQLTLMHGNTIAAGEVITLYRWFLPAPYTAGNMIEVNTYHADGLVNVNSTSNTKAAINFQPGKNYVVYVTIDGVSPNYVLKFSNAAWE